MKKVYAKFLTMLTVMSLAPAGAAMAASSTELPVEFDLGSSISISLSSSSLKITDLLPGEQKNSNVVTVRVSTNNESGYTLSATVGSSENESKNLVNINTTDKFAMVSGENQALGDSTWGYSLGGASATTFSTLPLYTETAKVLRESSAPAADDVPFVIGARAKSGMSAGGYTNVINFVAVTNAAPMTLAKSYAAAGKEMDGGYYKMQDMSSAICAAAALDETGLSVKDTRDGKIYWIAKLADGNCWMTQNLDFNISTTNVKAADSDVTADWTTSSTYKPVATLTDASQYSNSSDTSTASWDAGNWYYDGATNLDCDSKKTTYEGCTGFSSTGDAHRHVGNMYSWNAATAGTGGTIISGQASGSICPKGWRLPTGGSSGEFKALQSAGSLGSTVQNWLNAPYYFTRTGVLWHNSNGLFGAGHYGNYWSSTPYSNSSYAYYLYLLAASAADPANSNSNRTRGMSVRCVAK